MRANDSRDADQVGGATCERRGPGGRTHRTGGVEVVHANAIGNERIDRGRFEIPRAVSLHVPPTLVVAHDRENIGRLRSLCYRRPQEKQAAKAEDDKPFASCQIQDPPELRSFCCPQHGIRGRGSSGRVEGESSRTFLKRMALGQVSWNRRIVADFGGMRSICLQGTQVTWRGFSSRRGASLLFDGTTLSIGCSRQIKARSWRACHGQPEEQSGCCYRGGIRDRQGDRNPACRAWCPSCCLGSRAPGRKS